MEIHIIITSLVLGISDGNTHGHLLAGVSGQVEHADAEEGDEYTGYDEVDRVEQSLSTQLKFERDLSLVVTFDIVVRVVVDSRA